MAIKTPGEVLIDEARPAIDRLRNCVIPLFHANSRLEAELLGSGVLLHLSGSLFLCTAKHVIDRIRDSTLFFNGLSCLEKLEGDFYASEGHDVAVLQLTDDQAQALKRHTPLDEGSIANSVQTANCKYVEFIGFPASKNRKIYQESRLRNHVQSNGCMVTEISATQIRLRFNPKRNVDTKTRQRVTSPDPHGMSGGAMFGIAINDATIQGRPVPMLVGISTDRPHANEVFGTNIVVVMVMIRRAYQVILPARFGAGD